MHVISGDNDAEKSRLARIFGSDKKLLLKPAIKKCFLPSHTISAHNLYLCRKIQENRAMDITLLFMPSGPELIIIVVIILLLFGGRKIPELMRGLGRGVKEFKDASEGIDEVKKEIEKPSSPETGKESSSSKEQNKDIKH
jgi:sec-independent protein translocase protein TatA